MTTLRVLPLQVGVLALAGLLTIAPAYAKEGPAAEKVHVVGKGQTLGRIAKRYRVSVDALREANGLKPTDRIHPGLSLIIPGKDGVAARAAHPRRADKAEKGQERGDRAHRGAKSASKEPAPRVDAEDPPAQPTAPTFRGPRRRGFVRLVRGTEKLEVQLATRHGRVTPNALASFSQLLRAPGGKLAMDPRLASLVGQVSEHFSGRTLHVVSGFRPYSPVQYTAHSNHNLGRAMDFNVEGIPNTTLRDYCRGFANAGVGFYPNSTFVHLDVRAGKAYWVDYARPGEAPRYGSPNGRRAAEENPADVEPHSGAEGPNDPDDGSR